MKGTALLLCAITVAQAAQPQLTLSGKVCHCSPWEAAGVCSQHGSDNALIVHENCNQFYKCAHGVPVAYFCPGITLYNPLAETCDWPQNVECGDRPIVEAPKPDSEQDDGSGDNAGAGNCNPEEAPALCAASGSDGVLVAHEYCNWFYKCAHGLPVAMHCDTNLLYNPHTAQCDWPHNVDCAGRPVVEVETGGDNGGEVDCDTGSGAIGQCNCDPAEAPAICAAQGSDGILVAHENCRKFYKCAHGIPVAFSCHGILLYNPYTLECDWPNNVDCGDRYCDPLDSDAGSSGNGGNSFEIGSSDSDNGGTGSDNGGGTCNCNPGEAPEICSASGSDGVLIAHEHCNKFYKCAHGVPVALSCAGITLYNPHTQACDWPHLVECGDRPIVETESGSGDNGGSGTDNGGSDTDNGGSGTDNGGGTCNCNPGEAPEICSASGSDGVLIAHEHCNKFYKCAHGVPVALNCAGITLYNPHTQACDWPHLVECGDRPIVETESGSGDNGGSGTDNGGSDTDNGGSGTDNGGGTCNPGEAPEICSASGSDGVLIAHEHCNKFYKCAHGVPVALNCAGTTLYNPHTQACDWPHLVECGDRPIVETDSGSGDNGGSGTDNGGSDTDNGGSGTDNGGGTCNCNPGEAPEICSASGSDGVLIAHEHCIKFYKCAHGVPVALSCAGITLYNPHTQACDWPHLVECGDRPIVETDSGSGDNGGGGTDNGGSDTDNGGSGTDNGGGTCNCNPGEAPEICSASGSDGVLIAHEHCNKFYKCAHGVPVALNCAGTTLYNPHTQACDWPHLVECGDRPIVETESGSGDNGGSGTDNGGSDTDNGGSGTDNGGGTCNCNPGEAPEICSASGSDGVLIAHEHCNKFYKCAHGVPVALNCAGTTLYNPHTQACDWPHLVECGDRPIVETDSGSGDNAGSGTDNGGSDTDNGGSGTDNGGGTCNCNPGEAPEICSASGSDGVLIAHEHCNKFYKCAHGVPVALSCAGITLYNPHTQACDWPHLVECGDRPIVETDSGSGDNGGGGTDNGGSDTDNGGSGTDNGGGTCNCNPGEAPEICSASGSDGVLIAHEHCNKFYKCANGVPVALNCSGVLLYNPHTQACDWPHLVDCGDRPIVETDSGNGDNGGSGTDNGGSGTDNGGSGADNGAGTCNCNPGEAPQICSASDSDGILVAHEHCNKFYKCANGVPVTLNCSGVLLYNPHTQACDWPHLVDCGDRPIVETDSGNGDNGGSGTDNGGCGTDNGGSGTDNGAGTCNCNPGEAPQICSASDSDGILVAHEHCNKFYKCANGVPVALNCSGVLLYNPHTQACDWPHLVDCGDRPIVETDSGNGDNGGSGTDNGGSGTDNGGSGTDNGAGTCNCNPGEAPQICSASDSDGILVAHEHCNKFYKCANGVPVTLNCSGVLLYNPHTQACDWPHLVDCGDRPIVETDPGNGDNGGSGTDNGGSGTDNGGGTCNCNPGEAPQICSASDSDGILVAHEHCNKFYKCANGVPVTLNCSGVLLYNPHTQACDWPHLVDCGDRPIVETDSGNGDNGGSGTDNGGGTCNCNPGEAPQICSASDSDGVLIAHEHCNKFYKCANGVPVALNCSGVLLYNPHTQACDWPHLVDCGDRPIVETDSGNGDNGGSGTDNGGSGTDNGGSGTDNGGGTCNCNPGEAPQICSASDSDGILVAHEHCNKFYKCANGVPVTLNCSGVLLYNPHTQACDWPHLVDCGDRPIVETDSGNGDNGGSGTDNGGGTCNCNPGEAPQICSASDSDGVLIAHEHCNKFYKCANGVPVALNCSGVLLYNPHTQACDWPHLVDCGDRPIVETESGNGDNGGSGTDNGGSGTDNGGGTCNCNPGEAPQICSASDSDGILVAHEHCNKFFKCANGVPVALNCSGVLLYNPHTQACDWPHLVDCGDRPIVETDSGNGDNGGSGTDNGGCGTDNGGSGTDNGAGTCNCNPGEAPQICSASNSDGILVAHKHCNKFYKCANGVPVALNCSGVLLYNPHTQACDWPHLVDCGDRPIVETDSGNGDNGGSGTDNGGSGTDNGGSGTDNGVGTCNCNPGEAPQICSASDSDGILVAHEHCNKFYKCANGVPVTLNCSGVLLYNPHTQACDWPHLVDCGDRPIVETDSGNGDNGGSGTDNGGSGTDNGGSGTDNGGGTCNCNPGEAPQICSASDSDGILVAHEHCNKFYKCANGVPVTLNCSGVLLYNPHTQACDWPHLVDCRDRPIVETDSGNGDNGGSGTDNGGGTCNCNPGEAPQICSASDSDGVLIAHEHCNKFYKCANGVPVALNCSGVLLYNPHTQACDWPHLVDCGDRPIVETESGNGDNGGSGTDNGGSGTDNGGGTCNCNPGEAPQICSASDSDGILVAHEHCNKFFKCANGVPVALNCSGVLLYNPHTQACDWPHLVDCGDRPIVETDSGNGDNGGSGTDNGGCGTDNGGSGTDNGAGTCNCNPGEAPQICSASNSDGILVAHKHCNKFYKCANGVPVTLNCSGVLLYNPHTQACDWPHLVDCGDRPIVETDSGNGDNGGSGTDNGGSGTDNGGSGTDNGAGTCNCNPGEAPEICSASGSDGVLIAHEHCNKFYKCANGVPVALNCSGVLLYNPHTQACDWPHFVDCGDRPIVETDSGNGDNGGSGTDNGGSGTDNGAGTCNCNPGEAPQICSASDSDGILVAHEHCNKFYKCANGVPVALNCSGVLLYNPHTQACDWPHLVDCGDRPIVETDSGNGDNGGSGTDNGGSGTDNGGGTCNCNPGEAPQICSASDSDGILVAHEHCNKFYKCANGVPVALNCSGVLLYNPHTQACDWPHLVDCGDRLIVETDVENGADGGSSADNDTVTENGGNNNNNDNADELCVENGNNNFCNCNPENAEGICGATGSDGMFVAHENCNQFYQCAHGIPVPKFCAGVLLYSPLNQRCDWPHLVSCGDRPIVENEGGNEDNGDGDNGGTDNEGTCNCNPEEAPTICSALGSDGSHVAHEHCNAFYMCAHGVPVTKHCAGDLLYNPYIERCDWPHTVDCGTRPIVPVEPGPGVDDKEEDKVEIEGSCDPSQAPAICGSAGSDGVFVAHENCNQYYICAHGLPVAVNCPSNLLYNPDIKDCDYPYAVNCGDRIVPVTGGGSGPCACDARMAPSVCAGAGSDGRLVAHADCSRYWVCRAGEPLARSCPPTLLYEPHSESCLWPAAVSCEGRSLSMFSSLNKHIQARRRVV